VAQPVNDAPHRVPPPRSHLPNDAPAPGPTQSGAGSLSCCGELPASAPVRAGRSSQTGGPTPRGDDTPPGVYGCLTLHS